MIIRSCILSWPNLTWKILYLAYYNHARFDFIFSFGNAIIEVISFWIHYEERSSWWIKSFDVGCPSLRLRLREQYLVQPESHQGTLRKWTNFELGFYDQMTNEKKIWKKLKLSGLLIDILCREIFNNIKVVKIKSWSRCHHHCRSVPAPLVFVFPPEARLLPAEFVLGIIISTNSSKSFRSLFNYLF